MVELNLRPYQREAHGALHNAWSGVRRPTSRPGTDHAPVNRAAVVLPTGTGKTVIFSQLGREEHEAGGRCLFLVHRDELALQAAAKLRSAAPHARIGIVKGSTNEVDADLLVGSVQTLQHLRRREQIARSSITLGVADEAHHAAAASWAEVMAYFGAFRPDDSPARTRWAGFTATMDRASGMFGKTVGRKLGDVWQEIVYSRPLGYFIGEGYLVKPVGRRIQVENLELDNVRRSRGDLQANDLGEALEDADAPAQAARALLEHAQDVPGGRRTAAFWPTVATAEAFTKECEALGIPAATITGTTPREERQAAYRDLETGAVRVLSTAMVLTEGWDAPWCDCILIARPTSSVVLYVQMVGRGLRPWAATGKTDCLVLDLTGASERHDLATLDRLLESTEEDDEDAPGTPRRRSADADDDEEFLLPDDGLWDPFSQRADGELIATDVDLLATSSTLWLRTEDRGWLFVPTDGAIYFLYPQSGEAEGKFALGRASTTQVRKVERLEKDLDLGYAMAWAERYAQDEDTPFNTLSSRRAGWRKRRTPPSPQQISQARFHGVPEELIRTADRVQLADLISIRLATKVLAKVS